MAETHLSLFDDALLRAFWSRDYETFLNSPAAAEFHARIKHWAEKEFEKERSSAGTFVDVFFKRTWRYHGSGEIEAVAGFTLKAEYAVEQAGQTGGTGSADLVIGWFGRRSDGIADTPQVLCEFKDIRSALDAPQHRKGNTRSPVQQCGDYLKYANDRVHPSATIRPTWGMVTDMNEFRLYHRPSMPVQYQRFVLRRDETDPGVSLTGDTEDAAFQRFLFHRLFHSELLLTTGGPSPLEQLLSQQFVHERTIENEFYQEYRAYREKVFRALVEANPDFHGTRGQLVRLAQRFLDRCLFILFCEDMGAALSFPPNLLRDILIAISKDRFYDPNDDLAWSRVKKLFESMRDGSPFYEHAINRFNGGLFETFPALESLRLPTSVFCAKGQGENEAALKAHKDTLLYLAAAYNFGTKGSTAERTINLYTLGRIFEQSITELEFLEAEADNRESVATLSKRKRDGVYYTPELVTHYIVEETVGTRLQDLRDEIGLSADPGFTDEAIQEYRAFRKDKRRTASRDVAEYVALLDRYAKALDKIRVVDPACGSGAFLIQAFERLYRERLWIANERERITGQKFLLDLEQLMRSVLSCNIYGVDINPESVELTRLALWLRTALPDRPLTALEDNIRWGNSLIGPDFYAGKQLSAFSDHEQERVKAFDWHVAFPEVFPKDEDGRLLPGAGFDCVIGNPPYVKLQHFRKIQPDVAKYLVQAKKPKKDPRDEDEPLYASTQTGNFDMYLPFIEKGVELINPKGRMGFIAPNLWLVNEYGQGLRQKVQRTRALDRWIDFKSFQVFAESITYTALQFFRGSPSNRVSLFFAPDGEIGGVRWDWIEDAIGYDGLPDGDSWIFLSNGERRLLDRLNRECRPLKDCCKGIIVGIQTSADHIFHLERLGPGRYLKTKPIDAEIEIEDALMKPLVSGTEAKRYQKPSTTTYLLFPYDLSGKPPRLWSAEEMEKKLPKGWAYLKSQEKELRAREKGKMDKDGSWWAYNYPKNLDKQELPKLGVAQTVPGMRVFFDEGGSVFFNNVRVNGIVPADESDAWFLLGILNAAVADFVFRRIAKPKEGGYFEANKQFIAPLPIPSATDLQKRKVGKRAVVLQELHTERSDAVDALEARLLSAQTEKVKRFPLEVDLPAIQARLRPGALLAAENRGGELRFLVDGVPVIKDVFVEEAEADFYAAQWRHFARTTNVTDKMTAERLFAALVKIRRTDNAALRKQVVSLDAKIETLDAKIEKAETEINDLIYGLYGLTDDERRMVESG